MHGAAGSGVNAASYARVNEAVRKGNLTRVVQLRDERVQKMYEVLDQQKSSYLTAFNDIYADVEAGRWCACCCVLLVCCFYAVR